MPKQKKERSWSDTANELQNNVYRFAERKLRPAHIVRSASERARDRQNNIKTFFQMRSAPDRLEVVQYGYVWKDSTDAKKQASGRRDWATSVTLAIILVIISSVFGFGSSAVIDLDSSTGFCGDTNATLMKADEMFRLNLTNLTAATTQANDAVAILRAANTTAARYKDTGTDAFWPDPYNPTADEDRLEQMEKELMRKCHGPEQCAGGNNVGALFADLFHGASKSWRCFRPEITCEGHIELRKRLAQLTNPGVGSLLTTIDQIKQTEDQFASEFENLEALADSATAKTAEHVEVLLDRMSLASTIYIYYQAACLLIGSAFLPLRPNIKNRLLGLIQIVNKPMFVLIFIIGVYIAQYAAILLEKVELRDVFLKISTNPCWLDTDFLKGLSSQIEEVCKEISDAGYRYHSSNRTWHYYGLVEESWTLHATKFYDPRTIFPTEDNYFTGREFPYSCEPAQVLKELDASSLTPDSNWFRVLYETGAFVPLLLPLVLAQFSIGCFKLFVNPLITHRGKVLVPGNNYDDLKDNKDFKKRIEAFVRAGGILPFFVWASLLIFLMVNFAHIKDRLDGNTAEYTVAALIAILCTDTATILLFNWKNIRSRLQVACDKSKASIGIQPTFDLESPSSQSG